LCRNTYKRLKDRLEELEIGYIIGSEHYSRYAVTSAYKTDVQEMLAGRKDLIENYDGRLLTGYAWAVAKANSLCHAVKALKEQDSR